MKKLEEFCLDLGNQVFTPGGKIDGKLNVTFNKSIEINFLKITLQGTGRGKSLNQWKLQNGYVINTSGKPLDLENVITSDLILFGNENEDPEKQQSSLHENGRYIYEFHFQLPSNLPSTFRGPKENDLGVVKYHIEAIFNRPNREETIIKKPIVINHYIPDNHPGLSDEPTFSEQKRLNCCNGGKGYVKIESSLKKGFFEQNQSLILSNYIENCSKKYVVPFARLVRKTGYKNKSYFENMHEVTDDPLEPDSWANWDDGKFIIPIVGPTTSTYQDITVEYFVRVGVRKKYGSDIFVDLPVIIGTVSPNIAYKRVSTLRFDDKVNYQSPANTYKMNYQSGANTYKELINERIA